MSDKDVIARRVAQELKDGDCVTGARRVIVAITHRSPNGSKIVRRCTLPITSARRVDLVVTELVVIRPTEQGLVLVETMAGVSVQQVLDATDAHLSVDAALRVV